MQKLLSVEIPGEKTLVFTIIGLANANTNKVKFQALVNDTPVYENKDYEKVRIFLNKAVKINSREDNEGLN